MKKFIFASDTHGDQQDDEAIKTLLAFTKEFKPDIRIHGGDLFDLRPLRKGASAEEKAESIQHDWECGLAFLDQWKPHHLLLGNHDQRLYDLAEGDGIAADFAARGVMELENRCRKVKCAIKPYDKRKGVLKLGNLSMVHGYAAGIYAPRVHALAYGNVLHGHTHGIDSMKIASLDGDTGMACGCLCKLDMSYNAKYLGTLRHAHGFAYGVILDDGSFYVHQAQKQNGSWLLPTNFKKF